MGWIADTNDRRVQAALGWTCDVCNAKAKHFCSNTIKPKTQLPVRFIDFSRQIDRSKP